MEWLMQMLRWEIECLQAKVQTAGDRFLTISRLAFIFITPFVVSSFQKQLVVKVLNFFFFFSNFSSFLQFCVENINITFLCII